MNMILGPLYKRSKTGGVLEWQIEVVDNQFRTISGQQGGKSVTSEWTTCSGKNIGRANATTSEEQALSEAKANYKAKIDKERYFEDLSQIDSATFNSPMLAFEYEKVTTKRPLIFPAYSQPKLDGMRCICRKDGMWSRNGKPIVSAPHIRQILEPFFTMWNLELDGEIYNHKFKDNFNKLISLAKKTKPTKEDLEESSKYLQYWVYDFRDSSGSSFTRDNFDLRLNFLIRYIAGKYEPIVRLLWTDKVYNQEQLDKHYKEYRKDGFEGQMIRSAGGVYEFCRSNNLLKRKEMMDEEFIILDILEGQGNRSGIAGAMVFERNGNRFNSSIIGSHSYCRDLLLNKSDYIGKLATVKFQNLTPDGVPRFPEVMAIRDYD